MKNYECNRISVPESNKEPIQSMKSFNWQILDIPYELL